MTMSEIRASDRCVLTARDIAPVVGLSAESIRKQAREDPYFLGFRAIVADGNVRIPRIAFIRFLEGGDDL